MASVPSTPPMTSWLPDSQASTACCHRLPAALPWALRPLPLLCPFDLPRLPFLLPAISVSPLQRPHSPAPGWPPQLSPRPSPIPTAPLPPQSLLQPHLPPARPLDPPVLLPGGPAALWLPWPKQTSSFIPHLVPFGFWALVLLASRPPGTGNSLLPHPSASHHQVSLLLFSHPVVSNSFQPRGPQHTRLPCPSPFPGVCSNSCPLSQ